MSVSVLPFVFTYNGQRVTAPGGLGGECVDLANLYIQQVYKEPHVYLNAADWAGHPIPGWTWVANEPTNYPPAGALVVWHDYPPLGIGPNGHIALVVSADPYHLLTFDQNWPDGSPCHLVLHTYGGVVGWQQHA